MTSRHNETIDAGCKAYWSIRLGWRMALALALSLAMVGSLRVTAGIGTEGGQSECPDEPLRSELHSTALPDCRAYEMVSPIYKEGYPLFVRSYAANGESAIIASLGTFAGDPGAGESLENGSVYLAARTPAGWHLSPLNPPLSDFVGQAMIVAEANDNESLWKQHTPEQPASNRGLYLRSSTGAFSFIGPLNPNEGSEEEASNAMNTNIFGIGNPVGATDDYGHVVLEVKDPSGRWPFDETVVTGKQHSIYEYSGTGNVAPVLVAVEGEKGSRKLIATCGSTLGGEISGSKYNSLSSDGEVVFFTLHPCGSSPFRVEVYARLHGAVNSALPAETVHVSASECTTACGEESGKNFEGASEDGKFVYFTSTQKLINGAVDGTVSGDATVGESGCAGLPPNEGGCNLYLYDFTVPVGERLRAVSTGGEVLGVVGIAEDGTRVYYVSRQIIGGAGENVYGKPPVAGLANLYVYDAQNGTTTFIATLSSEDGGDWKREFSRSAEVAGHDGRFLLFASSAKSLTPDDTGEVPQLYEYEAEGEGNTAELVRITKGENGFNEDGNGVSNESTEAMLSMVRSFSGRSGRSLDFKSTTNRLNVSTDGRTVFFATVSQLSLRATAAALGCTSLYEFHAGANLAAGSLHLVSDGQDTQLSKGSSCGVQLQAMDASGQDALFSSSDPLLASDVDGFQPDLYDARVGGGFGPIPVAGSCGVRFCEGASSVPPALPVASSTSDSGEAPVISTIKVKAVGGKKKSAGRARRGRADRSGVRGLSGCRGKHRARRLKCARAAQRQLGSRALDLLLGGNR
jgi:hypothetical protein